MFYFYYLLHFCSTLIKKRVIKENSFITLYLFLYTFKS
uniref:Uncharacterized protein n=1 Tax=Siphoviridae sp. ctgn638 TaxID=2827913 RepID=A0A8S5TLA8_9CAUD|nr:MAG TPA: hypothetical protein [Siphoviridae sp. ctgn638]